MYGSNSYDAIIVGAGHNGLVAACYMGLAGKSVLVLEKNEVVGGATLSKKVFPGVDARISVYSYLISLLPQKILNDLKIPLQIRRRSTASYTPAVNEGSATGLLISNDSDQITRQSFYDFTGNAVEYQRYRELQEMLSIFAQKVWPTLLSPLPSKQALSKQFKTSTERQIWEYMIEKPLFHLVEDFLENDAVRGSVFTDAKIGISTYPQDPTLLQNKTFLYHVIGQGTGEWRVPMGGMGALVDALRDKVLALGGIIMTEAEVANVAYSAEKSTVYFRKDGSERSASARYILFNTSSDIANRCLPGVYDEQQVDGSVFKINMLLKKLPVMKDPRVSASSAFTGTFHLNEGYEHMKAAYHNASSKVIMDALPGEIYCHSLTDPSILSKGLQAQGYHSLTLFGLDIPYHWFGENNELVKEAVTQNYLNSINQYIQEDVRDCLAEDASGHLCIEAKSPLDLEESLGLPKGNIFHGNLTWPFAERDEEAGTWGVETNYDNVYICGSSAKRGGAVSGIPGHNAAMRVLGLSN